MTFPQSPCPRQICVSSGLCFRVFSHPSINQVWFRLASKPEICLLRVESTDALSVFSTLKGCHGPDREEIDSFSPLFGQTVKKNHFFPQLLSLNCFWNTEKLRQKPECLVTVPVQVLHLTAGSGSKASPLASREAAEETG